MNYLARKMTREMDYVPAEMNSKVAPQNRAVVNRINDALSSRVRFRARMHKSWAAHVGEVSDSADLELLQDFTNAVAEKLEVPVGIFGQLESQIDVYDFNGNGSLQFKEAFKLVKHSLDRYRKALGGQREIDVPIKTPEQAGFTIVKVLGKGGQGTATLAKDNKNGGEKVLKSYEKISTNGGGIEDLKDEMELTGKVAQNPSVAKTYEIFQDSMCYYLVQDPFKGGDLETLQVKAIRQGVDLDEDWYKNVFWQCFSALSYLHEHGIIHCDIKEPNIMVRTDDYANPDVVIIDYGLAQTSLISTKGCCGTPGYIPPETWQTSAWYPRGDVFSMGVVCIQMLANYVPGDGKAGIFQAGARGIEDIVAFTAYREPPYDQITVDLEGDTWLHGCLEKNRLDRWKVQRIIDDPWFSEYNSMLGSCSFGRCFSR